MEEKCVVKLWCGSIICTKIIYCDSATSDEDVFVEAYKKAGFDHLPAEEKEAKMLIRKVVDK